MHGRQFELYTILVSILVISLAFIGCSGGEEEDPPDSFYRAELIVENGIQPLWMDNDHFLFCYSSDQDNPGIFYSDLEGNITTLYRNVHNYDYEVSPNGQFITFSIPTDQNAGLIIIDMIAQDTWHKGYEGSSPSFIGNDTLIYSAPGGQINKAAITWGSLNPEPIIFGYSGKASASGQHIAYLYNGSSGQNLRVASYPGLANFTHIEQYVGNDFVWRANTNQIFGSKLDPDDLSTPTIYSFVIQPPPNSAIIMRDAYRPSISTDGVHLFANRASGQEITGIYHKNIETGIQQTIPNFMNPVAASEDPICLAQNSAGIYLITIE